MAKRYHFRLIGPGTVLDDDEGVLANSIEEAAEEAGQLIAELLARGELPDPAERWRLEICDGDRVVLRSLQLF
ncbi:DUF6894 family protein [Methylobacterium sp. P31]